MEQLRIHSLLTLIIVLIIARSILTNAQQFQMLFVSLTNPEKQVLLHQDVDLSLLFTFLTIDTHNDLAVALTTRTPINFYSACKQHITHCNFFRHSQHITHSHLRFGRPSPSFLDRNSCHRCSGPRRPDDRQAGSLLNNSDRTLQ